MPFPLLKQFPNNILWRAAIGSMEGALRRPHAIPAAAPWVFYPQIEKW